MKCYTYCDAGCCTLNVIPQSTVARYMPGRPMNMMWSSAPIAPHSQPFIETMASPMCRGPACFKKRTNPALKPKPALPPKRAPPKPVVKQQIKPLKPFVPIQTSAEMAPARSICAGVNCRPLGLLGGDVRPKNEPPESIKQCHGDKRCEAQLVRRVSIMKANSPINRYFASSVPLMSPRAKEDPSPQYMVDPSPLPIMNNNILKRQFPPPGPGISPCAFPGDPACYGMRSHLLNNPVQQRMNIAQAALPSMPMVAPPQQDGLQPACPAICIQKCLPTCSGSCCLNSASQSFFEPPTD